MKDIALLVLMSVVIVILFCVTGTLAGTLTWALVRHFQPSVSFLPCLKIGFLETILYLVLRATLKK